MQADEITISRLADIQAALETARDSVHALCMDVECEFSTPEYAADVINEMMVNLNALTK
jgi:hypothetical protein